jgi:hypothetical protein
MEGFPSYMSDQGWAEVDRKEFQNAFVFAFAKRTVKD